MLDVLIDALLDTLKLIPFLFIAYILLEYIEHRASDRLVKLLPRFGRFSPAIGALTGAVPQCGFSVTAAKLYGGRLISLGTLAAVFIATSDEAIPVLFSHPELYGTIWKLLLLKIVIAIATGFLIDALVRPHNDNAARDQAHHTLHAGCAHDECDHGIFKPTLKHTATSALYIFIVIFAMGTIVHLVGEDAISSIFNRSRLLQPLLAALVGFIPNCASSILLTELFANGALTFGSLIAGLITNAGIGFAVLFRSNKNVRQNLLLAGAIFMIALLAGYVVQLF